MTSWGLFEQHVAGARGHSASSGRRAQSRFHERFPGAYAAGDAFPEAAAGRERDERCTGIVSVVLFQRRLKRPQFVGLHRLLLDG